MEPVILLAATAASEEVGGESIGPTTLMTPTLGQVLVVAVIPAVVLEPRIGLEEEAAAIFMPVVRP